jgi:hypothetical protein
MMYALEQPLILSLVLEYAGPLQWLFLGAVNKTWAATHQAVVHERLVVRPQAMRQHSTATSYTDAAASLSRVLYACACDAKLVKEKLLPLSKAAAAFGRRDVLIWAKATAAGRSVAWHQQLCMIAVAGNQLAIVQWLLAQLEEPADAVQLAAEAARQADLTMLQWACTLQPDWTEQDVEAVAGGAAAATTTDATEKLDWLSRATACDVDSG